MPPLNTIPTAGNQDQAAPGTAPVVPPRNVFYAGPNVPPWSNYPVRDPSSQTLPWWLKDFGDTPGNEAEAAETEAAEDADLLTSNPNPQIRDAGGGWIETDPTYNPVAQQDLLKQMRYQAVYQQALDAAIRYQGQRTYQRMLQEGKTPAQAMTVAAPMMFRPKTLSEASSFIKATNPKPQYRYTPGTGGAPDTYQAPGMRPVIVRRPGTAMSQADAIDYRSAVARKNWAETQLAKADPAVDQQLLKEQRDRAQSVIEDIRAKYANPDQAGPGTTAGTVPRGTQFTPLPRLGNGKIDAGKLTDGLIYNTPRGPLRWDSGAKVFRKYTGG